MQPEGKVAVVDWMTFLNFGAGVNSTAILALIYLKKLPQYKDVEIIFADTGGEKPETYEYLEYIGKSFPIKIIKSKEMPLWDYCKEKKILPMIHLRWCSQRWKQKPLDEYRKEKDGETIIGIAFEEKERANRWRLGKGFVFPLIDMQIDRKQCIDLIKNVGWKVPIKSGCWFCPHCKPKEFAELKLNHPDLFEELVVVEQETLQRLKCFKARGWYNEKYPLNELVRRKASELERGQQNLCGYCMG